MRLILARTKAEAWEYLRPDDKYLASLPEDLVGHCNCDLLEVGNFWARGDFKAEDIYYYCKSHNITMSKDFEKLVG